MVRINGALALLLILFISSTYAFSPRLSTTRRLPVRTVETSGTTTEATEAQGSLILNSNVEIAAHVRSVSVAAVAAVIANIPSLVLAIEDDYEYGAVDASPWIPIVGGVLAILTALLPIALRGGEQAFEEMRERDESTFGGANKDVLLKGKKK